MKKLLLVSIALGFCLQSYAASECSLPIARAQELLDASGGAEDETKFLQASRAAIEACDQVVVAANWSSLQDVVRRGKRACLESYLQGNSQLHLGHCYLKVADVVSFVTGK